MPIAHSSKSRLVGFALSLTVALAASPSLASQAAATSAPSAAPSPSPPPGLGTGAAKPAVKPFEQQHPRNVGYLGPAGVPNAIAILPPPPRPDSKAQALDQAIYLETRKLDGGPRWALATQDAVATPAGVETAFECAVGVRLTPATTPSLVHLLRRVGADAGSIVNPVKDHYDRPRPFIGNTLPICVARTAALAASPSYPSGHQTFGWAIGLILAEIEPDRATPILARARAYGESRVVCGVHWASDVQEGRDNGASLVAALQADPTFRTDLEAARRELAALRTTQPPLAGEACRVSDAAAAHTPWAQ